MLLIFWNKHQNTLDSFSTSGNNSPFLFRKDYNPCSPTSPREDHNQDSSFLTKKKKKTNEKQLLLFYFNNNIGSFFTLTFIPMLLIFKNKDEILDKKSPESITAEVLFKET